MTQEFVTLPREVVEQVRGALAYVGAGNSSTNPNLAQSTCRQAIWKLDHALRAALEQPQNHVPDVGNMVQAGWKLVPVEPTEEMLRAGCGSESPAMFRESLRRETDGPKTVEMVKKIVQRHLESYRAMLAASPQPPTTEQYSAVQPQCEQEPVAVIGDVWTLNWVGGDPIATIVKKHGLKIGTKLYTHPQNLRCKSNQARLATLWGYVKAEQSSEVDMKPAAWLHTDGLGGKQAFTDEPPGLKAKCRPLFARAIEAAHNIK